MIKVITYGTFDLFHYGHQKLLERAKALGDYLIVGITSDDYDAYRGKINRQQPLIERIKAIEETGLADQIIIEEYEGQKIDDIVRYNIDVFAIGSDWEGKFDYLKQYCDVVYLERTDGISSSIIRDKKTIKLGIVGDSEYINKVFNECSYVDGLVVQGICSQNIDVMSQEIHNLPIVTTNYEELLTHVDAVFVRSHPSKHYAHVKKALETGIHVLCESPVTLSEEETKELFTLAEKNNCLLMEALKTAYSTAYSRLISLAKSGEIGDIVSIRATCTSIRPAEGIEQWNALEEWGPTSILPVIQLLGTNPIQLSFITKKNDLLTDFDVFSKINFIYQNSVASCEVSSEIKSEGDLVISGSKGYIYVPAPWWKTDYYEVRFENPANNKRFFYHLNGEGIRNQLVIFKMQIGSSQSNYLISKEETIAISRIMESFNKECFILK